MKVSKITSEFSKGYWNIYLSGYDEDGKKVALQRNPFGRVIKVSSVI